jgi:energy-coupling factor transporter ATP-binding protein EcfA2
LQRCSCPQWPPHQFGVRVMSSLTASALSDITFDEVSYRYPGRTETVLRDVNWRIEEGAFVLVAGLSGSGKSTLLRCLNGLIPHFSGGQFAGEVSVRGVDTRMYGPRVLSREVGFVFQDPEAQMVTERVEDEVVFGMEQLGVPPLTMRKRLEEVLDLMGIAALRDRDPSTLSAGERQRVAVASALALQPRVIVLDEPTSQLDLWGAEDVLTALTRLNEDLGLTIVLAEHRLERIIGHTDQMRLLLPDNEVIDGSPREVLSLAPDEMVPPVVRLSKALGWSPLALTIKEGRQEARTDIRQPASPCRSTSGASGPPMLTINQLSAAYGKREVLRDIDLEIAPGELVALMGRNGSGKTTLLRSIMRFHRPASGKIAIHGRDVNGLDPADIARDVGYVPQNPTALLFSETVREELAFTLKKHPNGSTGRANHVSDLLASLDLDHLRDRHPRDLSVGERERTALAAILVANPRILLLDEPTRGMDYRRKAALGTLLKRLAAEGTVIILATHDVEMVAYVANRVVLLGEGEIVADGPPREVLSGSLTFSTQINKLYGDGFLTVEDVLAGLNLPVSVR